MTGRYQFGGRTDLGIDREKQEDYISCQEPDENTALCLIADGNGSVEGYQSPAVLAVSEAAECVMDAFTSRKDLFLQSPDYFLLSAIKTANKVLGGFKMGNEEKFGSFSSSISILFLSYMNGKNHFYLAHSGNTRIYLLRDRRLLPLTEYHTVGAQKLEEGEIGEESYYLTPERLQLTSGLGVLWKPEIQTRKGTFRETDLFVMTTDGIHYALRPEGIVTLIINAFADCERNKNLWGRECNTAAEALVRGAKEFRYPDNMSAIVIRTVR